MVEKMKLKALQYRVLYTIKFSMPPPRYIFCAKSVDEKYNDLPRKMGKMNKKQTHFYIPVQRITG